MLITLDRGFGDIHKYAPGSHEGIVIVRPASERPESVARLLESLLRSHSLEELSGVVAQPGLVRVRHPS